jgi:hypothetical protein
MPVTSGHGENYLCPFSEISASASNTFSYTHIKCSFRAKYIGLFVFMYVFLILILRNFMLNDANMLCLYLLLSL